MNLKNVNKKIIGLAIILLILAGILVVALKGFKVDLMLERHESINYILDTEFEIKDIKKICKEVFGNKHFVVRKVEVFSDAVNINVSSITDEEKEKLVSKVNEKYSLSTTTDSLTVKTTPNVRIRDMIKPYIVPVMISIIIIGAYLIIRFKKMNSVNLLFKLLALILITEASIASVIAIARIPFSGTLVNLMAIVAIIELIIYINIKEKEYVKISLENSKNSKKK